MSRRHPLPSLVSLSCLFALLLPALAGPAEGADIWTDFDGDGLSDGSNVFGIAPGSNLTVDLWIDSGSFSWTGYILTLRWNPDALTFETAEYSLDDGTNFPIDIFTEEHTVNVSGFGFDRSGTDLVARVRLRYDAAGVACVAPVIEDETGNENYSTLYSSNGSEWVLFDTAPGSCFESEEYRQETTWGGIKATYR